jgi:hypothetical protein
VKQLDLQTRTELSRKPTLFWANARIVMKTGREIPLNELSPKFENIVQPQAAGQDYFGGPIKIAGTEYSNATPAQPTTNDTNGLVHVDLSGSEAVRFKAVVGSDYPPGPEAQRRKVYAVKAPNGSEARFLTVIEPYENLPMVKSAEALSADSLRVELTDGRVQEIGIQNFDGPGTNIVAQMTETRDGKIVRQESTSPGEGVFK